MTDIAKFLGGLAHPEVPHPATIVRRGVSPFVTISRQAAAGGHTLAERLIALMEGREKSELFSGWQMFDEKLCERLLQDTDAEVSLQSLLSEEYRSQVADFIGGFFGAKQSSASLIFQKTFETIRALASVGKVIIVGRAGAQVTQGLPQGVHVRLVAPEYVRIQRMAELLGVNEKDARLAIQRQDRDRARLVKDFFHSNIDDPLLYDFVCNSEGEVFEPIAQAVICLIKQRARD
jgi:hypothetical protein